MAPGTKTLPPGMATRAALLRLGRKHLERFVGLVPRLLISDDPKLIHDLRVRSRRVQQILRVLVPRPAPRAARKIVKALRRLRRALGPCRNLDVILALARKQAASASTSTARAAWEAVAKDLSGDRSSALSRARRWIAKTDLPSLIERAQAAVQEVDASQDPLQAMKQSLKDALVDWDRAYSLADQSRAAEDIHALRIAGKRLRYRAELLVDMGNESIKILVDDLKQIQDALGDWHDGAVLVHSAAEFIRRPNFVERHTDLAGVLLAGMEQEQKRCRALVDRFFTEAPVRRKRWFDKNRRAPMKSKPDDQLPLRATTRSTRLRRSSNTSSTDADASTISKP